MHLTVNGEDREIPQPSTVGDLVHALGLLPAHVVVERNGQVVPREQMGTVLLAAGDRLEIVRFVGGG
jgi:thiamine biosynthesis protein ThiS